MAKEVKETGKLEDYSGPYIPGIKQTAFTEEALQKIFKTGGTLYMGLYKHVVKLLGAKFGMDKALEMSQELWFGLPDSSDPTLKQGWITDCIRICRAGINNTGTDVEAYFKDLQLDPTMQPFLEVDYDLKDKNHGTYTVKRCEWLEKMIEAGNGIGSPWQHYVCDVLDGEGFPKVACIFNPKMKTKCLQLPTAGISDKGGVACAWEFSVD